MRTVERLVGREGTQHAVRADHTEERCACEPGWNATHWAQRSDRDRPPWAVLALAVLLIVLNRRYFASE
jgi:hypothetical protein